MTQSINRPCAVLFCTPDHQAIATALAKLCERHGLKVYVGSDPETQAQRLFQQIKQDGAQPVLVVHGGGKWRKQTAMSSTVDEIGKQWRSICFAGSQVGQEAIKAMSPAGHGTLLLLGHVSATQHQSGAAAYGAASAGLRSFAQSMAREFGPKGIHVVHAMRGGDVSPSDHTQAQAEAVAMANALWMLHKQHRSTWTHEIDLQPETTT